MLKVFSHCSRVLVNRLPPPPIPALLNNRLILSVACCSTSSSRKRSNWSSIETSAMWVVMRRPGGSFSTSHSRLVSAIALADTSHIATLQPSATSWRASSRPMPVPPPVMTAIFPAKSFMGGSLTFPVLICVIWSEREDFNLHPSLPAVETGVSRLFQTSAQAAVQLKYFFLPLFSRGCAWFPRPLHH